MGLNYRRRDKKELFYTTSTPGLLSSQPHIQWVPQTTSLGVKCGPFISTAEIKNVEAIPPLLHVLN
jgi:hypothetical protein